MTFEAVLAALLKGETLESSKARRVFSDLFQGKLTLQESKAFLVLLADRGETAEEVSACVEALRQLEKPLSMPFNDLVDTCGTGGDGKHSINVSTLAAFVMAGAGARVAKHGNRAISSRTGSSDLMEALGVRLDAPTALMRTAIRDSGIGYFHAPVYHPVFARVQPLRKSLGIRTVFNLLGPLVNPCKVAYQLTGVSRKEHLGLYAEVFKRRKDLKAAMVCHSEDGMDEISLNGVTHYAWIENGRIRKGKIQPGKLGLKPARAERFKGGGARENARFARQFLSGRVRDARRDLILLNAAAGLWISGMAQDLKEGLHKAVLSVDQGKALQCLEGLVRITTKGKA